MFILNLKPSEATELVHTLLSITDEHNPSYIPIRKRDIIYIKTKPDEVRRNLIGMPKYSETWSIKEYEDFINKFNTYIPNYFENPEKGFYAFETKVRVLDMGDE